ncbi:hypothetical protein B0A49_01217 [Cryomyces minteri]|uniref:Uncharacterized protein n=1 Tax=Cryomyces minteri TaxID=331657 RepID=A0A4U0XNY8_9PEZI|nr:hypothetical protein B0A49_01217 [Cryomyces minteri]
MSSFTRRSSTWGGRLPRGNATPDSQPASRRQSASLLRFWKPEARNSHLENDGEPEGLEPSRSGSFTKGRAVDPATTHTDVHVVALSPASTSLSFSNLPLAGETSAVTTVQTIESNNSLYEIFWEEDVDLQEEEDEAEEDEGSSSSDTSSEYRMDDTNHPEFRGIEKVNTKLVAWSWAGGQCQDNNEDEDDDEDTSPGLFGFETKYYDDDIWTPTVGISFANDEIPAPPNSERPSHSSSRTQSRPQSEASPEEPFRPRRDSTYFDKAPASTLLSVPGNADRAIAGKRNPLSLARQLSNLPPAQARFTGHRDSVAVAKERRGRKAATTPTPTPALPARLQRDSIAVTKARLQRTRAPHPAALRLSPRPQRVAFGALSPIPDGSPPTPHPPHSLQRRQRRQRISLDAPPSVVPQSILPTSGPSSPRTGTAEDGRIRIAEVDRRGGRECPVCADG